MQNLFIELISYIYYSFNLSKLTLLLSHDTYDINLSLTLTTIVINNVRDSKWRIIRVKKLWTVFRSQRNYYFEVTS